MKDIKSIEAVDGMILIKVSDESKKLKPHPYMDQELTVRQVAERAAALNAMVHKFPKVTQEDIYLLIDVLIAKIKEAKAQQSKMTIGA